MIRYVRNCIQALVLFDAYTRQSKNISAMFLALVIVFSRFNFQQYGNLIHVLGSIQNVDNMMHTRVK